MFQFPEIFDYLKRSVIERVNLFGSHILQLRYGSPKPHQPPLPSYQNLPLMSHGVHH